jgi:hypothetical protein
MFLFLGRMNTLVEADYYSGYIQKTHRHQYEHLLSFIKIYLGGDTPLSFEVLAKYPPSDLDSEKFKFYSWLMEAGVEKLLRNFVHLFFACLSRNTHHPIWVR